MTVTADQLQLRPRVKRWSKPEYLALIERGGLVGQRVFLFRGELIEMPAMGHLHAMSVMRSTSLLSRLYLPAGHMLRVQLPFDAPGDSMPEPDFLICTELVAVRTPHPNTATLVIEIADSSLDQDHEKALEYAAAQIPEYWIVDVVKRKLDRLTRPAPARAPLGWAYTQTDSFTDSDEIEAPGLAGVRISVRDLLP